MPVLKKIVVQDFRNIAFQELEFSPNINCISGNNGEGKTNLLDAIYCLSMTKSAFSQPDRYNCRYGTDSFVIGGTFRMENETDSRFSIKFSPEGKKLIRDDKPYSKISDHIGVLPVVMISPSDISMVSESGEERRRFANSVLSQMDREYLAAAQVYTRLLAERNKLLKSGAADDDLLEVFDLRMQPAAETIYQGRKRLTEDLLPAVKNYYSIVSGGAEDVSIEYRSDISGVSLSDLFRSRREKDRIFGYTTAGVQRDDFIFKMNSHPVRHFGSQGQQKSFLVALKFAQYDIMKRAYGFPPTLLLDDVFDKLDMTRIANLISMVAGSDFGQIFITDSNKVRLSGIVDRITEDRAYFDTAAGVFTKLD